MNIDGLHRRTDVNSQRSPKGIVEDLQDALTSADGENWFAPKTPEAQRRGEASNGNSGKLQYSEGSTFTTPAALETFPTPGTYTATAGVTDQFGATNTTSTTFTVP